MRNSKYTIGLDFGTLSARALLVDVKTGEEISSAVTDYPNKVMDEYLPEGSVKLEHDWALQDPKDYLYAMQDSIHKVLEESKVDIKDIIGISSDFTACTMLPVDSYSQPLCFSERFKQRPHAYVKLWKHHAAQDEANMLNEIAEKRGESFLKRYGGKISSEWLIPKIWQIYNEDRDVYDNTARFMEATDWISLMLTGVEKRNSCTAGYKALWNKREGYPSNDFFKALDPGLENLVDEKLGRDIYALGGKAGELESDAHTLAFVGHEPLITGIQESVLVASFALSDSKIPQSPRIASDPPCSAAGRSVVANQTARGCSDCPPRCASKARESDRQSTVNLPLRV